MQPHNKLFIPGPVEVSEKTMAAFSRPMIGHRSEDFRNLYRDVHPKLQKLFATKQPVFLSTSSAWGVMEASIRNLVDRGVLCINILRIDVFSPLDLQRLRVFSTALGYVEPFVGEGAAHAAKHAAIDQVADRGFHHAPGG